METHVADSGANVPEISSGSTLIRKGIGYTSAVVIVLVSSLILTLTARAHDPSHQYTIGSRSSETRAGTCAATAQMLITSALMSGRALKVTTVSALKAFGST
jgi:hypothetical protein